MKKYLIILTVIMLAGMIALPAFAEVEFKYGGMIRFRFDSENNVLDGTDTRFSPNYNSDDNQRYIDQRTRFFFEFAASQNLKVVVKFIMGDAVWGDAGAGKRRLSFRQSGCHQRKAPAVARYS